MLERSSVNQLNSCEETLFNNQPGLFKHDYLWLLDDLRSSLTRIDTFGVTPI